VNALPGPIRHTGPTPWVPLTITKFVVNVKVADAHYLDDLVRAISGAEYDKQRMTGLLYRSTSPKIAASIFTSGKVNLTGLQHPDMITPALAVLLEGLRTAGATLHPDPQPRIVNLVTTGPLSTGVSLLMLAFALDLENIEYAPETFPGLVYRSEAGGTALIFGSGAVVLTGTRSLGRAQATAAELWHLIDTAGAWMLTGSPWSADQTGAAAQMAENDRGELRAGAECQPCCPAPPSRIIRRARSYRRGPELRRRGLACASRDTGRLVSVDAPATPLTLPGTRHVPTRWRVTGSQSSRPGSGRPSGSIRLQLTVLTCRRHG
jgi:transcription initiation factor TFIID TATA-box-binding protein